MTTLKKALRITSRCTKWWGIFLLSLLFFSAVALITGNMTVDVELNFGFFGSLTNPMLTLVLLALFLALLFFLILFVLALPIVFLLDFRSRKTEVPADR